MEVDPFVLFATLLALAVTTLVVMFHVQLKDIPPPSFVGPQSDATSLVSFFSSSSEEDEFVG
jgi:hypothetical protein